MRRCVWCGRTDRTGITVTRGTAACTARGACVNRWARKTRTR